MIFQKFINIDVKELIAILFCIVYVIVKPIVCYYYIKINNQILNYGIEGKAILIEVSKSFRIPYDYHYTVHFYFKDKLIKISSKIGLYSNPGVQNEIIKVKYLEKYPNKVYICNYNYRFTYIIWMIQIVVIFIALVAWLVY